MSSLQPTPAHNAPSLRENGIPVLLKDNVDTWITIGWIVGTIFLLWIAISQVLMIRYGWSLVARKREQVALAAAPTTPAEDLPSATV